MSNNYNKRRLISGTAEEKMEQEKNKKAITFKVA